MANDQNGDHPSKLGVPPGDDPLLKTFRVPEGWSATIFAQGPKLGFPHHIRATPGGELFVSAYENHPESSGSGEGKILQLIDRDRDGIADEIHEFALDLDSPRGLEWDGEWLYVMDPPHLNALRDTDGDHIADETRHLVKGITSGNGITLGIDGWLYLAIDDRGFVNAEGTDGATLQLRGGGVVRVRPDGSGLHLFSEGVHGILEVAVSPTLDAFARSAAAESVGWNARLHHFTGLDHHGYPSLFRNFADDIVSPLAQYSSGDTDAGAGALFLDEPDLPEFLTTVLLTIEPAGGMISRHQFEPAGATFRENTPHDFIAAPDPAAIDVDAEHRFYVAARNPTIGENAGFVALLEPPHPGLKTAPETPAPIEAGLPTPPLIQYLQKGAKNRSFVQQAILRRTLTNSDLDALEELAAHPDASLETRIAALFTMKLGFGEKANVMIASLAENADLLPFALRALGDFPDQKTNLQPALFSKALSSKDPRTQREAVFAIARLKLADFIPELAKLTASDDPVIRHMSINALAELRQFGPCFAILDDFDNYALWPGVFRALARIHDNQVVDGIITRLEKSDSSLFRAGALKTLARLYHQEGEWDGKNSDSLPDTRGPYLDPVTWEGTVPIDAALRKALRDKRVNKTFLFGELSRNRIPFDDFQTLLSIAAVTPEMEVPAVALILDKEEPPPDSLPFLTFIATSEDRPGELRLDAATALARAPDDMAATSAFRLTLERDEIDGLPQQREDLKDTLLKNAHHESRYDWLLEEAHGRDEEAGELAWTILLQLTQTKHLDSGARREIETAISRTASKPVVLRRLLLAIADLKFSPDKALVINALDHPDPSVSEAARNAAAALGLDPESESATDSQ